MVMTEGKNITLTLKEAKRIYKHIDMACSGGDFDTVLIKDLNLLEKKINAVS